MIVVSAVKSKTVLVKGLKTHRNSGGTAPLIRNLGTRWGWVVDFTPRPFYAPGKESRYQLSRGLGRPQSQAGRFWKREKSPVPTGIRTPNRRAIASRYTDCPTTAPIAVVRTSDPRMKLVWSDTLFGTGMPKLGAAGLRAIQNVTLKVPTSRARRSARARNVNITREKVAYKVARKIASVLARQKRGRSMYTLQTNAGQGKGGDTKWYAISKYRQMKHRH